MAKHLLLKVIILILPFIIILTLFNYTVDANYIFHSDSEPVYKDIAYKLSNGFSVYVPDNYENRNLQEDLYRQIENIDIIVLGASRGRQINQKLFNQKLINSCVSSGTLEDVLAFSGMIFKLGLKPKKVIIETSPYLFNPNAKEYSNWQLNEDFYDYMINLLKEPKNKIVFNNYKFELLKELLSVNYFKINLNSSVTHAKTNMNYTLKTVEEIKFRDIKHTFIMPDGVVVPQIYVNGTLNTEKKIKSATHQKNGFRDQFTELSIKSINKFEELINYYQEHDIEIIFFLAPYSPYAYDVFISDYPVYIEAENYLNSLANERGIQVIGSYSPHKYNLYNRWDFHDYAHPSRNTVEHIFEIEYINE